MWEKGSEILARYYFLLALLILVVNLYGAVGLDGLMLDDWLRYSNWKSGELPFNLAGSYGVLLSSSYRAFIHYFSTFSPVLSRILVISLVQVPIGLIFFYICRILLAMPLFPAFFSSALSATLPAQGLSVSFVDGSHNYFANLLCFVSAVTAPTSLGPKVSYTALRFLISAFLLIWASFMSESIVTCLPPVLAIFFLRSPSKSSLLTKLPYVGVVLIVVVWKLFTVVTQPRPGYGISSIPASKMWDRLLSYIHASLPYPINALSPSGAVILLLALCIVGVAIWSFQNDRSLLGNWEVRSFIFGSSWFITFASIFVVVVPYFKVRYIYVASLGLVLALISLLFIIFRKLAASRLSVLLILVMFAGSTLFRHKELKAKYTPYNECTNNIRRGLLAHKFPANAQIVVLRACWNTTGALHAWGSGFLKYVLDRPDVTGFLTRPQNVIHSPFAKLGYVPQTGLSRELPLFVFLYVNRSGKLLQTNYVVDQSDGWKIYSLGKLGEINIYDQGRIKEDFSKAFEKLRNGGLNKYRIVLGS